MTSLCICYGLYIIRYVYSQSLKHPSACQSVFVAGKSEILHFFKNNTPSHAKISSDFTSFGSFSGAVFDSQNFLDHHSVSIMLRNFSTEPQLCNKVIQSVSRDCNLLMWMYKVKKCNFYVSLSVNNDRSQNLICGILLHFLTSGASKKFCVGQNYTYWVCKRSAWIRALHW